MRVILASKSPRRKEILDNIGLKFEVVESNFDETIEPSQMPEDMVKYLAYKKAESAAHAISDDVLIIGADTVVVHDSKIMGKPENSKDSFEMLKRLSGNWHNVYTGICVLNTASGRHVIDHENTRVKIKQLTDKDILDYIKTGESADKAGSYAIQGMGSLIVERIEGCYFNVVGLPINKLSMLLKEFGVNLLESRG